MNNEQKEIEKLFKSYWNKEPFSEENLYYYFISMGKSVSYRYKIEYGYSYDIDDLTIAAMLSVYRAAKFYSTREIPDYIVKSVYRFMENGVRHRAREIRNKHLTYSLNILVGQKSDMQAINLVEDKHSNQIFNLINKELDNANLRKELLDLMDFLCFYDDTKQIILRHYGFYEEPKSFSKISDELGISYERVIDQHNFAIREFRKSEWFKTSGCLYMYGEIVEDLYERYKDNSIYYEGVETLNRLSEKINTAIDKVIINNEKKDIMKSWGL